MPNFTTVSNRMGNFSRAAQVLPQLQQIYEQCKAVGSSIDFYQAGGNTDFNTAINSIFNASERSQLATMLTQLNQLTTAWEANHQTLLGLVDIVEP